MIQPMYRIASRDTTLAERLRQRLFPQISDVLEASSEIQDTQARLLLQSACLDMIAVLEEFVEEHQCEHVKVTDILASSEKLH